MKPELGQGRGSLVVAPASLPLGEAGSTLHVRGREDGARAGEGQRHLVVAPASLSLEEHPNSSTLAWKIPWTKEPGGLQSMGSLGVGHY